MFAIIRSGGKQYKVESDNIVLVEKLNHAVGDTVIFDSVLMIGDDQKTLVGSPVLDKACVAGVVVNQDRADKVIIFKKKRRHTYRRKKGHRQHQTVVRIKEISADGVLNSVKVDTKESDAVKTKPAVQKKIAAEADTKAVVQKTDTAKSTQKKS